MAVTFMPVNLPSLAARATTLWERLEHPDLVPGDPSSIADERLATWSRVLCGSDDATFARRLAWDGLDRDTVRRALGVPRWPDGTALPRWTATVAETVALGEARGESPDRPRFVVDGQPLPFEEILTPFVLCASRRLAGDAGTHLRALTPAAVASLERSLLRALADAAGPALAAEFDGRRERQRWALARQLGLAGGEGERTLYTAFVREMAGGGLAAFLERYPVLARLLATIADMWVDASREFVVRLEHDRPLLEQAFAGGAPLGDVVALEPSLSDPHRGRRSVMAVTFAGGVKVVYKPKDLALEEGFCTLLSWIAARAPELALHPFTIVNRRTHGWVEFVERRSCGERDQVVRFYRRSGMLLCLLYVLEATDASQDNLVAHGEHPVLIDMETLLFHRTRAVPWTQEGPQAIEAAFDQWEHSVLRTAMLPVWEVRGNGRVAIDRTGLGGLADGERVPGRRWVRINTDAMALEPGPVEIGRRTNIPRLDGTPIRAGGFAAEIVGGFRQMYRFLMKERAALLSADSPLHGLGRERVRFIHRPTDVYYFIREATLYPRHLADGADRSLHLDVLCRAMLRAPVPPAFWPLVPFERRALECGDIPLFTASADGDALDTGDGGVIASCFREPSFARALAGLAALSDDDERRQVGYIEASFFAHGARMHRAVPPARDESAAAPVRLDPASLVTRAVAMAEDIRATGIIAGDGSAAWVAPQLDVRSERFHFRPLAHSLYAGAAGVGVFLAAVDRVAAGGWRALAAGAVASLRSELRRNLDGMAARFGLGAGDGLGSLVYGLATMGMLLDDEALDADAAAVAAAITPERVAADTSLDVLSGTAGALLGLLALHDRAPSGLLLARAIACGRHLVARQQPMDAGGGAWPTLDGRPLTGFSHGAAGIALALLRLHAASGEAVFERAARSGIAYEAAVRDAAARNWPDFRFEPPAFPVQWCHGAAGIGLARLAGLRLFAGDSVGDDIDVALARVDASPLEAIDHVCCGNMGQVETLAVAGERLRRPELYEAAVARASRVAARADAAGSFTLHPMLPPSVPNVTFFQGTAGIGYTLLRLARPGQLPSVLSWDSGPSM